LLYDYHHELAVILTARLHPHKVLDVGCNDGSLVKAFLSLNCITFGCDNSPEALSKAHPGVLRFLNHVDVTRDALPFGAEEFDLITMVDVIEHFAHFKRALSEVHRVLKNDGYVYVSTPSPLSSFLSGCRDPTHVNVHRKGFWIRLFVENDFTLYCELPKTDRFEALSFIRGSYFRNLALRIYGVRWLPNIRSDLIFEKK